MITAKELHEIETARDIARKKESAREAIERNDQEILAEWESADLKPIMFNGRPVSLYLAKLMGLTAERIERF